MSPLISVLMPVFNAEDYLATALDSVSAQTEEDFEIVIVDDGSADSSYSIIERKQLQDRRIRCHRIDNSGMVTALNAGLGMARGKYIARMDADDICFPHRFSTQIAYLKQNPDVVAVSGSALIIDNKGLFKGESIVAENREVDLYSVPAREHYLVHPFLMARKAAVDGVGGYRELTHSEDADLYYRLEEIGGLKNLNEVMGKYRVHEESVSGKSAANGRIQSVTAQVAALSARRRRAQLGDFEFEPDFVRQIKDAATGIVSCAQSMATKLNLSSEETAWLVAASIVKYIHHERWRPYSLTSRDANQIRQFVSGRQINILNDRNQYDLFIEYAKLVRDKCRHIRFDGNFYHLANLVGPKVLFRASRPVVHHRIARFRGDGRGNEKQKP